jgi:hypothetical protein
LAVSNGTLRGIVDTWHQDFAWLEFFTCPNCPNTVNQSLHHYPFSITPVIVNSTTWKLRTRKGSFDNEREVSTTKGNLRQRKGSFDNEREVSTTKGKFRQRNGTFENGKGSFDNGTEARTLDTSKRHSTLKHLSQVTWCSLVWDRLSNTRRCVVNVSQFQIWSQINPVRDDLYQLESMC